jgi:hypothetical protein
VLEVLSGLVSELLKVRWQDNLGIYLFASAQTWFVLLQMFGLNVGRKMVLLSE